MDVSSHIHAAKRLWANRPCGEMSIAGRNVNGAKRPYTWRSVHEANCQFGRKIVTPSLHITTDDNFDVIFLTSALSDAV